MQKSEVGRGRRRWMNESLRVRVGLGQSRIEMRGEGIERRRLDREQSGTRPAR